MPAVVGSGSDRRGADAHRAIYAATLEEIRESGFAKMSIESIAARVGVHKTTIYRRWRTRSNLLADALADNMGQALPIPDTGDVEEDLRQLLQNVATVLKSGWGESLLRAALSDAPDLLGLRETGHQFWQHRFALGGEVVRRGVARGQLPASTDPDAVIESLIAPLYLRLLITVQPLDDESVDRAAKVTYTAARAGAFVRPET